MPEKKWEEKEGAEKKALDLANDVMTNVLSHLRKQPSKVTEAKQKSNVKTKANSQVADGVTDGATATCETEDCVGNSECVLHVFIMDGGGSC